VYFFKNDLDSALSYEQRALNIFLPLNNPELSDVYRTMAHIYHAKNDFNLALEHYEKALEVDRQHIPENQTVKTMKKLSNTLPKLVKST